MALNGKQFATRSAEKLVGKLNKEIALGNDGFAFTIAICIALAKDFLDILLSVMLIGFIPGVTFLVGMFLTTTLFLFMWGKGMFLKWKFKIAFWFFGLFIDGLPAFSVLPINTILVLWAWRIVKKRMRAAQGELTQIRQNDAQYNAQMQAAYYQEQMDYEGEQAEADSQSTPNRQTQTYDYATQSVIGKQKDLASEEEDPTLQTIMAGENAYDLLKKKPNKTAEEKIKLAEADKVYASGVLSVAAHENKIAIAAYKKYKQEMIESRQMRRKTNPTADRDKPDNYREIA